jgi:hypothetical protein
MNTALDILSILGSSILSSALVTAIVQIIFKERADARLERLRTELAMEKTAREEEAKRISERMKTQFSWLYVERARVMNDIYGCIIEAEEAIQNCIPPLTGWGLAAERAAEASNVSVYRGRVRTAMEVSERFEQMVKKSQLVFSSELATKLRSLIDAYESINFELDEPRGGLEPIMLGDSEAIIIAQNKAREILTQIQTDFRLLYGSLNAPETQYDHGRPS